MAVDYLAPTSHNGNGHFPQSRKAFHRGLPRRIGALEDQFEGHERHLEGHEQRLAEQQHRLDRLEAVLAALEAASGPASSIRLDNLVDHVARMATQLCRIDQRSLRSRRKLAVIGDQVAATLE